MTILLSYVFFFFNDTATTEIYTLSLHDALPIYPPTGFAGRLCGLHVQWVGPGESNSRHCDENKAADRELDIVAARSEEHTSELQSRLHLVCRLLLEKKKKYNTSSRTSSTST